MYFSLKSNMFDPAIPILGIYLDKTIIQKDTCSPVFIATPFTIAKTWKQPKSSSAERWTRTGGAMGYYAVVTNEKCDLQQHAFN